MNAQNIYILIAIIVFLIIFVIRLFVMKKKPEPLSLLAALAFVFIIAGIAFGENRCLGYGLMGIGVVLAIIDMIRKSKAKKEEI